jgi:hypothetical protein
MMRRIATTLVATIAFVPLLTGTAAAGGDDKVHTWNGRTDDAGMAVWIENGDTLRVCDHSADGHGVRGYIYLPNPRDRANGEVLIKASDPKSDGNCVTASKNLNETINIAIKVCRYQGSWVGNCDYALI